MSDTVLSPAQQDVLEVIRKVTPPVTHKELERHEALALRHHPSGIRTAVSDLVKFGLVRQAGSRKTGNGRPAKTWEAVPFPPRPKDETDEGLPPWYLLYSGGGEDGRVPPRYVGRTMDEKVAKEHAEKVVNDPRETGYVLIIDNDGERRARLETRMV